VNLKQLIGSGDRIMLATLPVAVVAIALNLASPALFAVGGPPEWLAWLAVTLLAAGVTGWLWSAILILRNVPSGRLITSGPYALARHPLYSAVALLVLPAAGLLLDSWLGIVVGVAMYLASRRFARAEEAELSRSFGRAWLDYSQHVRLGWL
jgi:protein-S-isoprenylcysteine O-methyltransferase Ste14